MGSSQIIDNGQIDTYAAELDVDKFASYGSFNRMLGCLADGPPLAVTDKGAESDLGAVFGDLGNTASARPRQPPKDPYQYWSDGGQ